MLFHILKGNPVFDFPRLIVNKDPNCCLDEFWLEGHDLEEVRAKLIAAGFADVGGTQFKQVWPNKYSWSSKL